MRQLRWFMVVGVATAALQVVVFLSVRPIGGLVGASGVALLVSTAVNTELHRRLTFAGIAVRAWRVHLQAGLVGVVAFAGASAVQSVVDGGSPLRDAAVLGLVGTAVSGLRYAVLRCWVFVVHGVVASCAPVEEGSSPIEYRIDRRSGVSTYMQIVQQTKQALRLGLLMPGDRLPTAKQVVEQTAINPNTVLKAYRELEREGLVEPRPGAGTFVRQSLVRAELTAGGELRAELDVWMRRGRDAGLGVDDVDALYAASRAAAFPPEPPAAPPVTGDGPVRAERGRSS